jgi:hypothetical protein
MSADETVKCCFCGKVWTVGVGAYAEYSDGDVACSNEDACEIRAEAARSSI